MLFESGGSEIAAKVGEVIANWVLAHQRLLKYTERPMPPIFDLDYKSQVWSTGINATKQVKGAAAYAETTAPPLERNDDDRNADVEPCAKRIKQ